MPYDFACAHAGVEPLSVRRYDLGRKIFRTVTNVDSVVYTTFFTNDETQILFLDSDDIPPIPYHGPELTNIGLLSTLHWLNINNLKI